PVETVALLVAPEDGGEVARERAAHARGPDANELRREPLAPLLADLEEGPASRDTSVGELDLGRHLERSALGGARVGSGEDVRRRRHVAVDGEEGRAVTKAGVEREGVAAHLDPAERRAREESSLGPDRLDRSHERRVLVRDRVVGGVAASRARGD